MDKNNLQNYQHNDPKKWFKLGFFNGEEYLVFVFKKTEKISAAMYMVSELLKDSEPLKWELREKALILLTTSLSINSVEPVDKSSLVQTLFSTALETLTLLNLALLSRLISNMNAEVLTREIESVVMLLKDRLAEDTSRAGYVLSDMFFKTDDTLTQRLPISSNSSQVQSQAQIPQKDQNSKIRENKPKIIDKNSRQSIIIDVLKKDSRLTVKDFTKVIKDCSEKTIQRELLVLVEKGLVQKDGERRWSRYSLK